MKFKTTKGIEIDIKDFITVRSHLFLVEAESVINQARYKINAIIRREGKVCRIIYWKEG